VVGFAEALVRHCVHGDIAAGRSERKGALANGDSLVIRTHEAEIG
jgi:hypothetical protein